MKIQDINNNQNIANKAHFKINKNFEKLYSEQTKHTDFKYMAQTFKNTLPKHEIEITKLKDIAKSEKRACELFNNATKQIYQTVIPLKSEGLVYLTTLISLMKNHPFFKGVDNKEYDCLDLLTKE